MSLLLLVYQQGQGNWYSSLWEWLQGSTDTIAALAAVAAALVAVTAVVLEGRRQRTFLTVDLEFRLQERFNSPEMLDKRRAAARFLCRNTRPNGETQDLDTATAAVLNFFEMLGGASRNRCYLKTAAMERLLRLDSPVLVCVQGIRRREKEDSSYSLGELGNPSRRTQ